MPFTAPAVRRSGRLRKLLRVRGHARLGAGSCTQPPARRPTVTAPGGTAPGKRIEGRRCARRTAAISSLSPPKGPRRVARPAAHRPRRRKNRPGDRTGTRARHVSPWRTLSDAGRPRYGQRRVRPARDGRRTGPRKTMEASDTAAAVEPHARIRREMQAPPGKLVLLIVSTVFGALCPSAAAPPNSSSLVGKEAEANHGYSSLSETSTLIGLRLDRRQASPTVLGEQLGKIG